MKKLYYILVSMLMVATLMSLPSCKTKKVVEDTSILIVDEKRIESEQTTENSSTQTEEKGSKTTDEKSTEKADRKTETTDLQGNKTIVYENYYKGSEIKTDEEFQRNIFESLQSVINTQSETNTQLFSEIKQLNQKESEIKNSLIYGSIIAGSLVLIFIIVFITKKFFPKK